MADEMSMWQVTTRLVGDSEEMRRSTSEQIERMGQAAVPLLARVIELDWISQDALSFARSMLTKVKPRFAGETPDTLIQAALECETVEVCEAVSQALVNFGAAASPPLLALLTQGNNSIYSSFAWALGQIAKVDPSVIPAAIKAMDDENWNVRGGAAEVLFEGAPVEAIAPLIRSLKEESPYHRIRIINTLEQFGATAIPALIESLCAPDWRMRVGSAEALGMIETVRKIRSDHEPYFEMGVVAALLKALDDERVEVLRAAADALCTIGPPETNLAIPELLNILRERNALRFPVAAEYMSWIPHSEPGFESELIDSLSAPDASIRVAAAKLLLRIKVLSTSLAVPVLLAMLKDDDEEVRFQAARALAEIAPEVSGAGVPILRSVLEQGPDWTHREELWRRSWDRQENALRGLARHGPAAAEAVPALIDALDDFCIAEWATNTLRCIGPLASAAVPALLRALQGRDEDIRASAAMALAAIGPEAASAAVSILLERLRETDEYNRCSAADGLGRIGLPAAKVAIPALRELMTTESERLRDEVAWALESLGCPPPASD